MTEHRIILSGTLITFESEEPVESVIIDGEAEPLRQCDACDVFCNTTHVLNSSAGDTAQCDPCLEAIEALYRRRVRA